LLADVVRAKNKDKVFRMTMQLLSTGLLLEKYINTRCREYDQNRNRIEVLLTLILHNGTMKPTDLSNVLYRSRQSITQTIDSLERDGLVKRALMDSDRRTKQIVVTRKGLDSIKENQSAMYDLVYEAIPVLTQHEIVVMTDYLIIIRKHLSSKMKWDYQ
jgi:MarR family transcriptional regulator for hemolysin